MGLQPFGPWPLFQFLNLYTVGRTPWKGDHPVARPLPTRRATQTQNKRTQTSMSRVRLEPTIPVFEQAKMFHDLDRAATVIGCIHNIWHWIRVGCCSDKSVDLLTYSEDAGVVSRPVHQLPRYVQPTQTNARSQPPPSSSLLIHYPLIIIHSSTDLTETGFILLRIGTSGGLSQTR
jgi:hypothetical protein